VESKIKTRKQNGFFDGVSFLMEKKFPETLRAVDGFVARKIGKKNTAGSRLFTKALLFSAIGGGWTGAVVVLAGLALNAPVVAAAAYMTACASMALFFGATIVLNTVAGAKSVVEAKKNKKGTAFLSGVFAAATVCTAIYGVSAGNFGYKLNEIMKNTKKQGFVSASEEFSKAKKAAIQERIYKPLVKQINKLSSMKR